jgi:pimeloyl-ACP methyl ester carboxylesterase
MEIKQRHVRHGQTTIGYTVQGTGHAVLLLPSLGRGPGDFDLLAELLAERAMKVIRPWPRGLGDSRGPSDSITLHDFADDVAAVIRHEGSPDAVIAGHAFGNFVARTTASDHPSLVRGVVLLAGSPGKTPDGQPSIPPDVLKSVYASSNLELQDGERLEHLKKAFFAPGNDPSAWLQGWYPDLKAFQTVAWGATPVHEFFSAGSAPLLDLQAALDTVAPRSNAHFLKDSLGDRVTIQVIAGAGHALIPEKPQEVAEAIAKWVGCLR